MSSLQIDAVLSQIRAMQSQIKGVGAPQNDVAKVAGAEGQLFYRVSPGQPVLFVDGNLGGKVAAIEYGNDEIEYTVGEPIGRADITVDGE